MIPDKYLFLSSLTLFYNSCILKSRMASKIVLMPMFGNSHYHIFRRIAEELGDRGHEVCGIIIDTVRPLLSGYRPLSKVPIYLFILYSNSIKQLTSTKRPLFKVPRVAAQQRSDCSSKYDRRLHAPSNFVHYSCSFYENRRLSCIPIQLDKVEPFPPKLFIPRMY